MAGQIDGQHIQAAIQTADLGEKGLGTAAGAMDQDKGGTVGEESGDSRTEADFLG